MATKAEKKKDEEKFYQRIFGETTTENIKQYLAMRNLMETIRDMGEMTGGPKPFGPKDAHAFANALNSFLDKNA